jgi:hypothetical protein
VIGGKELPHIARSTVTKTEHMNGSKMEIALGGTVEQANGPRVPRLHRDEIELLDEKVRKQAGGIPAGRKSRDGRYMPQQTIDTSTMKWAGGYVDLAIEEYNDAISEGHRPRQEVRISCIFESAAENPACRSVPEEQRRARLIQLRRNPDELCECITYRSGFMPNEDPDAEPEVRTLDKVCQGRFFKSRGYKEFDDITSAFQEADPDTWDSERECSQPAREGAFLKAYSQLRSGIKGYEPDPEYGDIYTSTDWGGSDEHSHGWYQWLQQNVEVTMWKSGSVRVIPAGSVVRFAEIYRAQIGDYQLGELVIQQENEFMLKYPGWHVKERYCDVANLSARLNWRDQHNMETLSRVKKDFDSEVKMVRALVGSRYFFIDIPACPMGDKALRAWKKLNGHEVHDWASHPMAEARYFESNRQVHVRESARKITQQSSNQGPRAADDDKVRETQRNKELQSRVVVTRTGPTKELEVVGATGAADSPMAEARRGKVRVDGYDDRSTWDRRP